MIKKFVFAVACLALISGCASISGGVAPSTVPLNPGSYRELGPVAGEDCVYYLLGFIPLRAGNETRNAVADAMGKTSGTTALVNVSVDTYSQYFVIVSRACTQVYGTAVAPK
ncbi:MAG: hypothetical protein ED859_17835 [Desulfuromonadales bacterium]|nr:MAG: hypothetical protein ED859_17835 [Desulfuromonadales bacterium]